MSSIASLFAYRAYDANEARRFSEASSEIRDALEVRTHSFESMLLQLAGLYALSPDITVGEFHDYAGYAGLPRNDRGVYTFGVFKRVPTSKDADRMIIQVHEVNPNVPYRPAKPGDDVSSDPVRMEVIKAATEEAKPKFSGVIVGLQNLTGKGYMLVAPAYRGGRIPSTIEDRRRDLIGIAYLRFSEGGVFDIFQGRVQTRTFIDMEVYAGRLADQTFAAERRVLDRNPDAHYEGHRRFDFEMPIGGRPFTVRVFTLPGFDRGYPAVFAGLILLIGATLSFAGYQTLKRKEARDHRLLQSERQLKLVTESLPAMIAYIDTSLSFRLTNKAFDTYFKQEGSAPLGRSLVDVVGERNYILMRSSITQALGGDLVDEDWSLEQPNGRTRQFQTVFLPDVNANGAVKGVVMMWNDITERRKSEEQSKFLSEFSTVLAASLDPQQTTEKVAELLSPALAEWCAIDLFGLDGELNRVAVSGQPHPLRERTNWGQLAAATGAIQREELGDVAVIAIPLRSADGILGAMTLGAPKATQPFGKGEILYAIEIALRASLAIQNARLYTDSQELNRAKDNFLAMLSHELRTPMNVILGWLEILTTEDVDDETYKQALETLNRNARIQIQLINELLDVSRIINGKLTVHPKFCDLGELAEGALASVKPAAQAKHITYTLTTEGDLETLADPERFQQILWNLLSNALKFTPQEGQIHVSAQGSRDEIILSVQDTGAGIDKAFLPYVFDRFRQEESSFAKHAGGLGLGLSIVRYLAEAHGGSITVQSEGKGKGAKFTLVMPRAGLRESLQVLDSKSPHGKN